MHSLPFTEDRFGCSREGAAIALPKAGTQKARVYEVIQQYGPLTDLEIVARTGYTLNVVNARRYQLVQEVLVEAVDTIRGVSGARNTRWQVVKARPQADGDGRALDG